jgi:hypothetical protein
VGRAFLLASAVLLSAASAAAPSHGAKAKKPPPPKPAPSAPTTVIDETAGDTSAAKPKKKAAPNVELAMCEIADLGDLEAAKLLKLVRKCKKLTHASSKEGKEGKEPPPIPLDEEQMLVAICVRKGDDEKDELVDSTECGLKVTAKLEGATKGLSFGEDGDYALALRNAKLVRDLKPTNGGRIDIHATSAPEGSEPKTVTAAVSYHATIDTYSNGKLFWLPLPMLTTDFSSSKQGYRLGITPLAVAVGWKWFPSSSSSGYLGFSPFIAWNLLIPNDTQTLSNGTFVRINYKAFGAGVLLDAAGWFAVGAGLGKTFTSDNRTDFRMWFYFGPKLLAGLGEF